MNSDQILSTRIDNALDKIADAVDKQKKISKDIKIEGSAALVALIQISHLFSFNKDKMFFMDIPVERNLLAAKEYLIISCEDAMLPNVELANKETIDNIYN